MKPLPSKRYWVRCLAWLTSIPLLAASTLWGATITFNGAVTNQVIDGFGVNASHRSWNNDELKPVLDALIDQAGMTLFRVVYDNTDWESTNDNSSSTVLNWSYYNSVYSSVEFNKLWNMVGYLNGRGISNGIVLTFMGAGPSWLGGASLTNGMEDEWAEMLTSVVFYGYNTAGVRFRYINPVNEPDIFNEGIHIGTATQYTNALHKLAVKLDANGLSDVRLVGPDLGSGGTTYMPQMVADPLIMSKLGHFGVHSYTDNGGGSDGVYSYVQTTPYPDRTVWITEFNVWCPSCDSGTPGVYDWAYCKGTAEYLLQHLLTGVSGGTVWEGYDSYYVHSTPAWSFWGLFSVDSTTSAVKTYTPRKNFYTLSQISKWVRPGAQRISVSGTTSPITPVLAFKHTGLGQFTIVGINTVSNATTLAGTLSALPPLAWLDLYYTSATTNLAHAGRVAVTNGAFNAAIPGDCVFTLTGFTGARAALTNPASGSQFNAPATIALAADATTTAGSIVKVEFYSGANKVGEGTDAPYAFVWTNVPFGDYQMTARALDTAGNWGTSDPVDVAVAGPLARIRVNPTNAVVPAGGSQQFLATGADVLGHSLNPQPSFSWSVIRGGVIDGNGRFTTGPFVGGPIKVYASSGGIVGTGAVNVVPMPVAKLGNTNDGTLTDNLWDGGPWINACRFLAASRMTAAVIHAKVTAVPGRYKCAVYTDSGGKAGSLLAGTVELLSPPEGWNSFPLISPTVLTNGQYYWLAVWSNDPGARVYYTTGAASLVWGRYDYGQWPNPLVTSGGGGVNYCAFIEALAPVAPVTWAGPAPTTYGTPLGAEQLSASCAIPGTFLYSPPAGTLLGAGLGQELSLMFSPQDTNTYLGVVTNVSIDVVPKTLVVTAQSTSKVFGAPLPALGASYDGFVNGETPADMESQASVTTAASAASDAGTYLLVPGGGSARNYVLDYHPGTLSINPASTAGILTSAPNPAVPAQAVTFTFRVSTLSPGAGTPTGQVRFRFDGTDAASAMELGGGVAAYTNSALGAGRHTAEAAYQGSLNFLGTTNVLSPNTLIVPQPRLFITRLDGGSTLLTLQGIAGEVYRFERTEALDQRPWITLGSSMADDSGLVTLTNPFSGDSALGFFRSAVP